MEKQLVYSKTFLYRIHLVTTLLDQAFEETLKNCANITLSQFTLLMALEQLQPTDQRSLSGYLKITPGAISRQVKALETKGWITKKVNPTDKREHSLILTLEGSQQITVGIGSLETKTFSIFADSHKSLDLFGHLDALMRRSKEIIRYNNS